MELIKQIKEAEAQAKEIIEQAKLDAASIGDDARRRQVEQVSAAQAERRQAIERAVADAESAGQGEVESLKAKAAEEKQQLHASAGAKIDQCVGRVVDYLQQI